MDDFTLNVRQIFQYTRNPVPSPDDLVLLQQGDGGAYTSVLVGDMMVNGLTGGGFIKLLTGGQGGIQFNGAQFAFSGGQFTFNAPLTAPQYFSGGQPVATLDYVDAHDSALATEINEVFTSLAETTVRSFNGRVGIVQLEDFDIARAGGALIVSPHFGGKPTVPSPWDVRQSDEVIANTDWVQRTICFRLEELLKLQVVTTFNGRFGAVTLTTQDVNDAYFNEPVGSGVFPSAPSPPFGDASTRIATTMFVDESLDDLKLWVENTFGVGSTAYAPLNSPAFTGIPTAPTANPGTTTGQLATTAFVMNAVAASTAGVASFNTRTGAVVLTTADVTGAGGAPLASPAFTGVPTTPTPAPGDNSTKVATTAFVDAAIAALPTAGVSSFNTRTGAVTLTTADVTGAGGAPIASPALTGTPTAPTAAQTVNDTTLATTAYVHTALAGFTPTGVVASFNSRTGAVTLLGNDISAAGGALVASPTFTGTPAAPTATVGTNTTQLATCAFVQAAVTAGAAGVTSFNGRSGVVTMIAADVTGVGGALLASPAFTGVPTAPTPAQASNDTTVATTAYVRAAISGIATGVSSFNSRTGAVTLLGADVSAAGGALLASPTFTGTPSAPTPGASSNDTSLATTAWVTSKIATAGGVTSFNGRAGAVTLTSADLTGAGGALLASPAFTGAPTAPTPVTTSNDTTVATTAFVKAASAGGGTPGLVLLNTLVASNVAQLQDTTSFTSAYDSYEIELVNLIPANATTNLYMVWAIAGTFPTLPGYSYVINGCTNWGTSTQAADGSQGSNQFALTGYNYLPKISTITANDGVNGKLIMHSVNAATLKFAEGLLTYPQGNNVQCPVTVGGCLNTNTGVLTGLRVAFAAGNIVSGLIRIYGRKTS